MVIFVEAKHDVVVLRFTSSDLTLNDQQPFQTAIEPFLTSHQRIILDMQDVRMVDGYGIGALLSCLNHLRAKGGDLKFVHVAPPLRIFFEIARVSRMFEFYESLPMALSAFVQQQNEIAVPADSPVPMMGLSDCGAAASAD